MTEVRYDLKKHSGLLTLGNASIIVVDAQAAKIHELPEELRVAFARSTLMSKAILQALLTRGILQAVDPDRVLSDIGGYERGLELLRIDARLLKTPR